MSGNSTEQCQFCLEPLCESDGTNTDDQSIKHFKQIIEDIFCGLVSSDLQHLRAICQICKKYVEDFHEFYVLVLRNQKKMYRAKIEKHETISVATKKFKEEIQELHTNQEKMDDDDPHYQGYEEAESVQYDEEVLDEIQEERLQSEDEQEVVEEEMLDESVASSKGVEETKRSRVINSDIHKKRRSKVWRHFALDLKNRAAFCKVCNQKLSYNCNATSNLLNHLKLVHSVSSEDLGLSELPKRGASNANHPKRSAVWDTFSVNKDTGKATCSICSSTFTYNSRSTSNLLTHIRSRHGTLLGSETDEPVQENSKRESEVPFVVRHIDPLQLQPRAKKKTSKVWDFYTLNEGTSKAVCNSCHKTLTYSRYSTSNLLKHLESSCSKDAQNVDLTEESEPVESVKDEENNE